jgi:glutamate synthase domain-containing protein 1
MRSALVVVHQRYSTNTFPTWALAPPFRFLGHNGEINTLRGNINNMQARYYSLQSDLFGDELKELLPVIIETGSDSACFDNMLELLVLGGRSLPMTYDDVAQAWVNNTTWATIHGLFFDFIDVHGNWDARPHGVHVVGGSAPLWDRNGMRPPVDFITKDVWRSWLPKLACWIFCRAKGPVKGRLGAGKMILVDTELTLLNDEEQGFICSP